MLAAATRAHVCGLLRGAQTMTNKPLENHGFRGRLHGIEEPAHEESRIPWAGARCLQPVRRSLHPTQSAGSYRRRAALPLAEDRADDVRDPTLALALTLASA
jgi:hypothetical protein